MGFIRGIGDIFDADSNTLIAVQASVQMNIGSEVIEIPVGNATGKFTIQVGQPITGRFGFRSFGEGILVALSGSTSAAPSTGVPGYVWYKEAQPVVTNAITLANTLDFVGGDMVATVTPRGGTPLKVQTAAPTTADQAQVTDGSATVSFFALAYPDGTIMDVSYFHKLTAAGTHEVVTMSASGLVVAKHFVVGMSFYDYHTDTGIPGGVVFDIQKLVRTGDLGPFGADVEDIGNYSFDWSARNEVDGDIRWYVPTERAH